MQLRKALWRLIFEKVLGAVGIFLNLTNLHTALLHAFELEVPAVVNLLCRLCSEKTGLHGLKI